MRSFCHAWEGICKWDLAVYLLNSQDGQLQERVSNKHLARTGRDGLWDEETDSDIWHLSDCLQNVDIEVIKQGAGSANASLLGSTVATAAPQSQSSSGDPLPFSLCLCKLPQ